MASAPCRTAALRAGRLPAGQTSCMGTPCDQSQPGTVRRLAEKVIDQGQGQGNVLETPLRVYDGVPGRFEHPLVPVPTGSIRVTGWLRPSSWWTSAGAQHIRRGQVVAAADAPILAAVDFQA